MKGRLVPTISKSMRLPDGSRLRFRTQRAFHHPLIQGRAPQKSTVARLKGKTVGGITTHDDGNEILMVNVEEKLRRKGVASGLLSHHEARTGPVRHSSVLTDAGAAWKKSVTKSLIPSTQRTGQSVYRAITRAQPDQVTRLRAKLEGAARYNADHRSPKGAKVAFTRKLNVKEATRAEREATGLPQSPLKRRVLPLEQKRRYA